MKRLFLLFFGATLLLSGCLNILDRDEETIIEEEINVDDYVISPNLNTPENYYRTVLQEGNYRHSEARGLVGFAMNNRVDINQLELGLMELAATRFPQDEYFFQEGQYLEGSLINRWLRRYDPNLESHSEGLNPPLGSGDTEREKHESQPAYLSHIMEHNYLHEDENGGIKLGGLVLGISLNSVYYYRTENWGPVYEYVLEQERIEEEGKRIAEEVLQRVRERENLANVPIMIALFQEEVRQSIVPGDFIALTVIEPGKKIERWERMNEEHYFFPSSQATTNYRADATNFANFKQDLDGFFDNYVGVIGKGRYKNNVLQEMTVQINLQSNGKAEIIALTQYATDRLLKHFPADLPIQVYIQSLEGAESIIVRHAGEQPFVHIYR